jgi:CcmD family protein
VAAAYLIVFIVVLAYVLIIAAKLQRLEREVTELTEVARTRAERDPEQKAVAIG